MGGAIDRQGSDCQARAPGQRALAELKGPVAINILWITTDHQQWRTIAGRSLCHTPNIQRLVDGGLLFNRSYAPMPVCCPVRAMWISGAYPWHNGVHT
ncbi:MAG TPA: sulfatase-like hydrolase/transferase, partial [Chloroflexota bacterium]